MLKMTIQEIIDQIDKLDSQLADRRRDALATRYETGVYHCLHAARCELRAAMASLKRAIEEDVAA